MRIFKKLPYSFREKKSTRVVGCETTALPQNAVGQHNVDAGRASWGRVPPPALVMLYWPLWGIFLWKMASVLLGNKYAESMDPSSS